MLKLTVAGWIVSLALVGCGGAPDGTGQEPAPVATDATPAPSADAGRDAGATQVTPAGVRCQLNSGAYTCAEDGTGAVTCSETPGDVYSCDPGQGASITFDGRTCYSEAVHPVQVTCAPSTPCTVLLVGGDGVTMPGTCVAP